MLTIRLQRAGKKNQPEFRIVLAQKTAAASKKFVEVLGSYNPRNKNFSIKDETRLKYWIAQHVELSPTIHNLFVSKQLLDAKKTKAFTIPKKPVEPEAPKAEAPSAPVETTETPPADDSAPAPEAAAETPAAATETPPAAEAETAS